MGETASRRVCVLLDDTAAARGVLELSSLLARHLQRAMEVVYVESASALLAAALPSAQALAAGAGRWEPLVPQDVERGFVAQAARLRALTEHIAGRDAVHWSMRVVRGGLPHAALALPPEADLVLLAAAAGAAFVPPARARGGARGGRGAGVPPGPPLRRVIGVAGDQTPAGLAARRLAEQLAPAMSGVLQAVDLRGPAAATMSTGETGETGRSGAADAGEGAATAWQGGPGSLPAALRCDLLVLPRARLDAAVWRRLGQPALLVGG